MDVPKTPENEALRLRVLRATGLLDSPKEEVFDSLTDTMRLVFDVPISAFSLIDEHRQWFKSIQGLGTCETCRDFSFCGHVVYQDTTIVVTDAQQDARFADNPLVTHDPFIRFYAGSPIRIEVFGDTLDLGSLCIIDRRTRTFSEREIAMLEGFARHVEALIQVHLLNQHLEHTCDQLKSTAGIQRA